MHILPAILKNSYYGFRHGESQANVEGIIVSDPVVGTTGYGLSEKGQRQVRESVAGLTELDGSAVIVSSDFKRAAETAEIIRAALGVDAVRHDVRLRERFFGEWEGACYLNYAKAWEKDAVDPAQMGEGVESANAVLSRMVEVILSLETEFDGKQIVVVSHGDPLLILQSTFEGINVSEHRSLPYFDTAGWRLFNG